MVFTKLNQTTYKWRLSLLFAAIALLFGCQSTGHQQTKYNNESLYQQLGGQITIEKVIKRMVLRLHRDKKLTELFVDVDDKELKQNLIDFICQLSDGGCEYQGAEMIDINTEMFITKAEFDHFVSLFIFSMQDENISFTEQNKLLARLAALRGEVINL